MSDDIRELQDEIIEFTRHVNYRAVRLLASGACGLTVLLHDDFINKNFVCKKFQPFEESYRRELFPGFCNEIKLLFDISHDNVARVFSYFLYPNAQAGFIIMEYIDGFEIHEYLDRHPEAIDQLFEQAISGFVYLESIGILHRDIRPNNLMVTAGGLLKIIDLGFGKRIKCDDDYKKSISINWVGTHPADFEDETYNFSTEVYFLGKVISELVSELDLQHFSHRALLRQMCQRDPSKRISSFSEVAIELRNSQFNSVPFSDAQKRVYGEFADELCKRLSRVGVSAKFRSDLDDVRRQLDDLHRQFMIEEWIDPITPLAKIFILGTYWRTSNPFPVRLLDEFKRLLNSISDAEGRIVLSSLYRRFENMRDTFDPPPDYDDAVPF